MGLLKYIDRLKRMNDLITRKATGTPEEFAGKLGLSKSMLMINLNELKEMGAPIKYDPQNRNYFYEGECKLVFEFERLREGANLKGGKNIFDWLPHSNAIRMAFQTFEV